MQYVCVYEITQTHCVDALRIAAGWAEKGECYVLVGCIGAKAPYRRHLARDTTYEWGKIGEESEVMQLAVSGRHTAGIDPSSPFAELWMGTHPSGPSVLREEQETYLSKYISEYPECLGSASREAFGMSLPFLFKVLSIRKALSIQAHPTKEHAQLLHRQRPDLYKDPNHKPELAIALSPFEALLAFRPSVEIAAFVQAKYFRIRLQTLSGTCYGLHPYGPVGSTELDIAHCASAFSAAPQTDQLKIVKPMNFTEVGECNCYASTWLFMDSRTDTRDRVFRPSFRGERKPLNDKNGTGRLGERLEHVYQSVNS
ncbi:mannose-6-phosphate isomerase [Clonorchis sinensis]|uniref:mannose-6-phosphate isomerase n=1 Tax=Clonorchis sinensis TaxID=79923 RepID=G7YG90_CLOSI|nr:mannose-6-phosphate isomerase [Clonorchis sinensis]